MSVQTRHVLRLTELIGSRMNPNHLLLPRLRVIQGTLRSLRHSVHQVVYVDGCISGHLLLLEALIALLMRLLVPSIHLRAHIRVTMPCPMNLRVVRCLQILLFALIPTLADL